MHQNVVEDRKRFPFKKNKQNKPQTLDDIQLDNTNAEGSAQSLSESS